MVAFRPVPGEWYDAGAVLEAHAVDPLLMTGIVLPMELLNEIIAFFDLRNLLLLAIVFIPLERLLEMHPQKVFRKHLLNDLIYFLFNRIFIYAGLAVLLAGTGMIALWIIPQAVRDAVASQPHWLQTIEAIIVADIGFYAAHRMFHTFPWLWQFHAVHHSIEELDWLAGSRVHPVDQVVTKGMSILPLIALGFSGEAILIFSMIYFWHSVLLHANVRLNFGPLRWLIASPEFHHWHHANQPEAYNKNYAGQLSFLDKLFGTMHMPGGLPEKYGVDDPVPDTYIAHLIYPFKRQRELAKERERPAGAEATSAD